MDLNGLDSTNTLTARGLERIDGKVCCSYMFLLIDYVIGYVCSIFRYFIVYVTSGAPNLTTGRLLMTFQSGFLDVHGLIRWLLFGEFRDQLVGFQNDKQQKVPFFVLYDPALQQYYWMCSRVNSHMACACAFIWQLLDAGHCVERNHSGGVNLTISRGGHIHSTSISSVR